MEALALLLMFFAFPGYSYVLQPRLTVSQIAELDRAALMDASISVEEGKAAAKSTEARRTDEEQKPPTNPARRAVEPEPGQASWTEDGLTPETNPAERTEENGEDKPTKNTQPVSGSRQGSRAVGEERLTSGRFSEHAILGQKTKQRRYSAADKAEYPDTAMHSTGSSVKNRGGGTQKEREGDDLDAKVEERGGTGQDVLEEEREGKLVAGISVHEMTRGDASEDKDYTVTLKRGNAEGVHEERKTKREEEGEGIKNASHNEPAERVRGDHMEVGDLTPSLTTSKIPAAVQIITRSQNPPPVRHRHEYLRYTPTQVPPVSSQPPTSYAKVSPQFLPPSVDHPHPPTLAPAEAKAVSEIEDLLAEMFESNHYEHQMKAGPSLEEAPVKNVSRKPARKNLHTAHKAEDTRRVSAASQPEEGDVISTVQESTPKPTKAKFVTKDVSRQGPNQTDENTSTSTPVGLTLGPQATGKKIMENDTKLMVKQNKPPAAPPQLNKLELTTAKTPSARPTKVNRGSKTRKKFKEKGRKANNKPSRVEEVTAAAHVPYFMDEYCPPDCACYGRVVQCSDKGVDKVPYGIPYNARYILLMNNHIDNIQLDLLSEYVSMEFLVLSNNRLTDGAIEGAFEGVPALKRLYLDRNLLATVPNDLPLSLEELRLDNNQLGAMSEGAWARCPGLLVLSLSNNSLGNGSESLPNAVLSPLCHLRTLNLDNNQLKSVPLGLPLSIKELYLRGNLIEQFRGGAFNGISELVVLDLSANRLTNKGLPKDALLNATRLESLNLEGNRLKQVPRHLPLSLKTLNLEGNLISSVTKAAFTGMKNLEHLGLSRNKISKVMPGAFRTLATLHQLDLCHNSLREVPRQLPQGLHSVALTHNRIQAVPRDAFCWGNKGFGLSRLVQVQLENNLIDMGKLDSQAFRCLRGFQVVHFY